MKKIYFLLWFTIGYFYSLAQEDSLQKNALFQSSVGDLLKIPPKTSTGLEIASASGKIEKIFEAPLAASVLTREEIIQAGALSLMEALRLFPGVLVRETSSGNYDINVRGFNNTPPGSDLFAADNSNTLVMIDNRPIFNYFSGGTFWEALPIDINDIERIELVRGPASALFGSNAVTGVINIITRRLKKEGFSSTGNLEYGSFNTTRASGSAGFAPNDKFQFIGSFNFTEKSRTTNEFYSFKGKTFLNPLTDPIGIESFQTSGIIKGQGSLIRKYPRTDISLARYGFNFFAKYQANAQLSFDLAMGLEDSYAVRPFAENGYTPHSTMLSRTQYVDLKSQINDGTIQISYLFGKQTPGIETTGAGYNFDVWDIQGDYNFVFGNFSIKPSIGYKSTQYDDTGFFIATDVSQETGILNGKRGIDIFSPALRMEYQFKNLRLIAAGRAENFIIKDKNGTIFNPNPIDTSYTYLAYQFAATYKIKDKHFFRASYSQANRGAFFTEVFSNWRDGQSAVQPGVVLQSQAVGNPNLKLRNARSLDFGYRFQWNDKFSLDVDVFRADIQDYTSLILDIDTTFSASGVALKPTFTQTNVKAKAIQRGITFSLSYMPSKRLTTRFFITLQKTDLKDFSTSNLDPELDQTGENNYLILKNLDNYKGTPSFYGGFFLNYSFTKWNFNLNGYFFDKQELTHISDAILGRIPNIAFVNSKILINTRIAYKPFANLSFYANFRNILGQDSFEYIFTDKVGKIFSVGLQYEF